MFNPPSVIVLWVIVFSYLILASVDFGTSFYLFYGQNLRNEPQYALLDDFLSPVSEITNICFVLFFAVLSGFSPEMTFYYQTPLAFSGILAVVLSIFKGTFFAVAQLSSRESRIRKICLAGNGITAVLIPAALSIAMVISEGGFVSGTNGSLNMFIEQLLSSFYFWSVMVIALISVFYISAMFLTLFAHSCGHHQLSENMRSIALFWSLPTVLASGFVFLGLERQNPSHFTQALNQWWMFLVSLGCLLLAVSLLFFRRWYTLSFLLVMFQYFFAFAGYTLSHLPYLVYPDIRVSAEIQELADVPLVLLILLLLSMAVPALYLLTKSHLAKRSIAFKKANT